MSLLDHPDYQEEKERLDYIIQYVEKKFINLTNQGNNIKSNIKSIRRGATANPSDLIVQTRLHEIAQFTLKNLVLAKTKPYFARIDFKEQGRNQVEKLYIGKMSLVRDEDNELVIIDWRAPISSLYYEGRIGNESYICSEGNIEGDLLRKRQFIIDEGKLKNISDVDVTVDDEILQTCLGGNAEKRLKDIVSTIQAEQNRIIRADMSIPLIVQGAAGSGKTTIALHRIAYLSYILYKSFKPENFMIIAPNKLFLNYISEVLPELGVENVRQTTFDELALKVIGTKIKVKDPNDKLVKFVDNNRSEEDSIYNNQIKVMCGFKTSMAFKAILDNYIKTIEESLIPSGDLVIHSSTIIKNEDIKRLYYIDLKDWPVGKRIDMIKRNLYLKFENKKDLLIDNIQKECDLKVSNLKRTMEDTPERQKLIIETIDKKNEAIKKFGSFVKNTIENYMGNISMDAQQYYRNLTTNKELFCKFAKDIVKEEIIDFTCQYMNKVIDSGFFETEDLAPMMYIKARIHGVDEKIPVNHTVIDEAQDFSPFQFLALKKVLTNSSFTILGDLCQGIHSYRGTRDWKQVKQHVFGNEKCDIVTLKKSYRTTVEIMEAANTIIDAIKDENLTKSEPVIRHGEEVEVVGKNNINEIATSIKQKLTELKDNGYRSIAIICKTMDECKKIHSQLKMADSAPYIISDKEKEYKGGVVIVPSYIAKGLEFDAVILSDASKDIYTENELDAKLLYVAMTRPLHKLCIYHTGILSPLLKSVKSK